MQSQTKRRMSPADLDALLRSSAGIGGRLEAELTDGCYNTAYRVRLDDGRPAIVKLAPPPDVPVLRYERGIMATEAMVYRRLTELPEGQVPGPELLYADDEFLMVSLLDGTPWDKVAKTLSPAATGTLRRELGAVTARLNTLVSEDGRFGYPAAASGLSAPDWRTAFTTMVDALLEDAAHWNSDLPEEPDTIRKLVAEGGYALDEVTEPRLVHFDLWPGNVFVDGGDHPRVTGLIDHERAFWGDPAAELISLAFGGDAGPDSDVVTGYVEAGGALDFTPALHHRLALYQLYLGLILVIEDGPRATDDAGHVAWTREYLTEAVERVRGLG
ncbi:aminoglycoside phosphotransferase family protein [Streptomyces aquilus]|uniref:Aminoglycoside phosphotransferase family protein n=1 Tax=Streptomyces aquilus TaxID=2548456 RepID=A0A3S9I459_9ACTN|nr:aminoglycoside phosphotransferase family protein [Streptomyces aquilus]AZP19155.1 aminoglycoside phosphotransferase family protein [Streptomyces aquilus]